MLLAPAMLALTPVAVDEGEIGHVLVLRTRPEHGFTRILQRARVGESGETYAFDSDARLISASRFEDQLKLVGLLPNRPGVSSILDVEVRDPGVDLVAGGRTSVPIGDRPPTRMAAAALAGEDGDDMDGYRDYRGVEVVGAWRWLSEHGFGVTTEVDAAEAFRPLTALRTAFFGLFGLFAVASVGVLFSSRLVFMLRKRVRRAVRKAERLGQYTLDEKIGEGGMGEVYRAHHVLLRRPTAVKLLLPDKGRPEHIKRFEREVQLTSAPHASRTRSRSTTTDRTPDGVFYYAMELPRRRSTLKDAGGGGRRPAPDEPRDPAC